MDFEAFLERREAISGDYINGNGNTLAQISAADGPATFYPPGGTVIAGAEAVNRANAEGARLFRPGSTVRFEILQSGHSGELGFWTGRQHVLAMLQGNHKAVPMTLRVTELFRRENGDWKLIHRHADIDKG